MNNSTDSRAPATQTTESGLSERHKLNQKTLLSFITAWNAGDINTLLNLMSENPVYKGSTGSIPGTVYTGRDEVRTAFKRMAGSNSSSSSEGETPLPRMYFFDNRALVFWNSALVNADGTTADVDGVDVLTFTDDGLIAEKDAYRKAFS